MHNKSTSIDSLSNAAVWRFLGVTFAGGTACQLASVHFGLRQGGAGFLILTMWMPAVAAWTTSQAARRLAWTAVRRANFRWLGLGLVVGWLPGLLKTAFLAAGNWGRWDQAHFTLAPGGGFVQAIHGIGTVLGPGPQGLAYFGLNLLLSVGLGSTLAGIFGGLGEELGWRAVLQPSLERRFGRLAGTGLVGLIWAYWHLPVNLAGYNDPLHPVLTAVVFFPLGVVAVSFGFAWLFRESRSVWPPALAHGANNTIGSTFLLVAQGWSADIAAELAALLLVGGWFAWLAWRAEPERRLRGQVDGQTSTGCNRK